MRHAGMACSKGIIGCRVAAHQVLTIFLIVVARRAFHIPEARWLPTSPGISAVTRPQALVGVDAATSHWPQSDRQGPLRRYSAAHGCLQGMGDCHDHRGDPVPSLVSRLRNPGNRAGPPGRSLMGHCIDRHPADIVKGLLLSMISISYIVYILARHPFVSGFAVKCPQGKAFRICFVFINRTEGRILRLRRISACGGGASVSSPAALIDVQRCYMQRRRK